MLPAVTVETEASQMLEAALEQMDDIIAGQTHPKGWLEMLVSLTNKTPKTFQAKIFKGKFICNCTLYVALHFSIP